MVNTISDTIYQTAFKDELKKIAGIPRYGLTKRIGNFLKNTIDTERSKQDDVVFKKTKVFKQLRKVQNKELKSLKDSWMERQKLEL